MHSEFDTATLIGSWTHAHEEDAEGVQVFRPSARSFPPSRGRSSFELAPDGSLRRVGPGADDRRTFTAGRWTLTGRRLVLHDDQRTTAFEIDEASRDRLVLRPTSAPEEAS